MAQVINTNVASLNAQRNLNTSQNSLQTSLERLSSGLRINSAKDDAAGLAISERFTTQIRGLNQAARNSNDGVSLAQTGEGDLAQVTNNLQRIRELAVQSANATNSSSDRAALQLETSELIAEIERVSSTSAFNGVNLLDGSFASQLFQVGANAGETVAIANIASARTSEIGQVLTATSTGTAVTGALTAGQLTVNGNDVGAVSQDALAIANAITAADSNVSATATNAQTGITFADVVGTVGTGTPTTLTVGAVTDGVYGNQALQATTSGTATGVTTDWVSDTDNQNFTLQIDGADVLNVTQTAATPETIDAARLDTAIASFVSGSSGAYTQAGTLAGGDLVISKADGTDMAITVSSDFATAGSFTEAGFVATHTDGQLAVDDGTISVSIDGTSFFTEASSIGGSATAAELDAALTTFLGTTAGAGYSVTSGSFATDDLVLSKADGSDVALTIANNATGTPLAFATSTSTNGSPAAAAPTYTLSIDGNALDFTTAGADGTIDASEVADLINSLAGYTATAGTGTLDITKDDGSNIVLVEGGTDSDATEGLTVDGSTSAATSTLYGSVEVTGINEDLVIAGTAPANAGLTVSTTTATLQGTTIANTDISTVAGANAALASVDSALTSINTSRASLGAIQNRFESIVSSIETSVENLSSARSRIRDADFASETAALTRNQILQQAGVSILSQANSLPQLALSLLQ